MTDPSVFTTLAFVTFSPEGDRSFSFARKPGADTRLSFEEIDLAMIDEASVFHFGTLSLTDDRVRTATKKCVEYAKRQGKFITFDPNLRLPLWETTDAAKEQILWGLAHADVVKISDEEVEFLWGITDEKEAAKKLLDEFGIRLAMITMGPKGAYLANQNGAAYAKCPEVKPIDTTGAGDIFGGSAVSRLLKTGKAPEKLTEEELAVYKRGRNAKSYTKAKNASTIDYRRATGFEAVMGYLYLKGDYKRMIDLIRAGLGEV